jgi:hypothetical protein
MRNNSDGEQNKTIAKQNKAMKNKGLVNIFSSLRKGMAMLHILPRLVYLLGLLRYSESFFL